MITLIVARARNGAIGRAGDIPWDAPEDLKFFQRETLGGAIIMGRNTWTSLPVKPLPKRHNIVVSSDVTIAPNVVTSVEAAIEQAKSHGLLRIYGIGGAQIYKSLLPLAQRLLITEVDLEVSDADTFFPDFNLDEWHEHDALTVRSDNPKCRVKEFFRII